MALYCIRFWLGFGLGILLDLCLNDSVFWFGSISNYKIGGIILDPALIPLSRFCFHSFWDKEKLGSVSLKGYHISVHVLKIVKIGLNSLNKQEEVKILVGSLMANQPVEKKSSVTPVILFQCPAA